MGGQWWGWCSLVFLLTSCYQWRCSHAQPDSELATFMVKFIHCCILLYLAVELELGSSNPPNNTVVLITDIGDTANQLVCTTELNSCCRTSRIGEWHYPNTFAVRTMGSGDNLYRTRRDAGDAMGGILLHRRNGATSPTGIYHCVIPGGNGVDQTLYVGLYTSGTNGMAHNESLWYIILIAVFFSCSVGSNRLSTDIW